VNSDEANEVLAIVRRIGPVILSSAVDPTGDVGTALRRAVGMMVADYNMTLVTMDRVRKAALAETTVSLPAALWVNAIVRLTLATEARILSYMTFQSRDQVEEVSKAINAAFSETSERAADDLDTGTYMALIKLHGEVVKFLADLGRQLPRVIDYKQEVVMTALRMAQTAYHDPSRYTELINENHVVHPAFMPREGVMLSL
jgi:prophage DNA circulation protein